MYSSVDDMMQRFGETELLRLSAPEGENFGPIDTDRVTQALTDASALIDSYLRKRYAVPMDTPPAEINRAAAVLARYDLASRGDMQPSEPMRLDRKDMLAWLKLLADGNVTLDGIEVSGDYSGAMVQDRRPLVRGGCQGGGQPIFREGWPQ
jgi:phage gp36-like protein